MAILRRTVPLGSVAKVKKKKGSMFTLQFPPLSPKATVGSPLFHSRSLQNEFWIEYFLRREFLSLCLSHCLSPSILSFYLSLSGRTRQNRNQESGARYSSSLSSSSSSSLSSSSHTNRGCLVTRKLRKHCELGKSTSILDLVAGTSSNHSELFSSRRVRNKPWP